MHDKIEVCTTKIIALIEQYINKKTLQAGEWTTCIFEVDFYSHAFRLQYSNRLLNVSTRTQLFLIDQLISVF